jgi:predicted ATPase/DNA-binding winged helix-turn-helix (wHTH) protein
VTATLEHRPGFLFGSFELRPAERLLLRDGAPVSLGSRAMDILLCLLERDGEVVSPEELLERVWRGVTVEPSALRVQISALRKALSEAEPVGRYVSNVAGRGYCLVAPISRGAAVAPAPAPDNTRDRPVAPPALGRMVGREAVVDDLEQMVATERFVSVVGPGGIGKTTVALALAHRVSDEFAGEVAFVDLAIEQGDGNVASAVAAALQLRGVRGEVDVASRLRTRRLLLILDNCEHVIFGAAALAEAVCQSAPQVRILATSREPLNALGEQVFRLAALETPPPAPDMSYAEVCAYPAAQLFVERVTASGGQIEGRPADAPLIADICRKLDGIPLAIELAAGRVGAFGLATTLAMLDSRLRLSWPGRRTALPRHVTLSAALDWSYNLLSADEAKLLRSLSAFVGAFTLEGADAIADDAAKGLAAANLPGLVSKSLVNTDAHGAELRYRLLDATRVYAADRLAETDETGRVAARHAAFSLATLRTLLDEQTQSRSAEQYAAVISAQAEVRSALAWTLTERNNVDLGVRLAAAAALAMLKTSRFAECRRWSEFALANLPDGQRGGRVEMELQTCLGLSRMLAGDNTAEVEAALARSLELADRFNERAHTIPILSGLSLYRIRIGDARQALAFAEGAERVASTLNDPASLAVAQDMLATSHHLIGAHRLAGQYSEAVLRAPPPARRFDRAAFGFEYRNRALSTLARVRWLSGRYQQAVELARRAVDEATELEHPASQVVALSGILPIFLWIGDRDTFSDYVARLRAVAKEHKIEPHRHIGMVFQGIDFVHRGDPKLGVQLMREAFGGMEEVGIRIMRVLLGPDYIHALVEDGALDAAQAEVDRTFRMVEATGYEYNLPELLRMRGEVFRRLDGCATPRAASQFLQALAAACRQRTLAWSLRAAISLYEVRCEEGRPARARRLVSGLLSRFTDQTETPDRIKAVQLLEEAGQPAAA